MSLQFFDGFNRSDLADLIDRYASVGAGISLTAGRDGTDGVTASSDFDYLEVAVEPDSAAQGVLGLALFVSALPGGARALATILDGSFVPQELLTFVLLPSGFIEVREGGIGGPALATTTLAAAVAGSWRYIELRWLLNASTGSLGARSDRTVILSQSGLNTAAIAAAWDRIRLYPGNGGILDDVYVLDGDGFQTTYLNPQMVLTSPPVVTGARRDWTSSTGTERYSDVDEDAPHDGDGSYVWADADAQKVTFGVAGFVTSGGSLVVSGERTIRGAALHMVAAERGDVTTRIRPLVRNDGMDEDSPNTFLLESGYRHFTEFYPRDPATDAPWTSTRLNAAEWGVQRVG